MEITKNQVVNLAVALAKMRRTMHRLDKAAESDAFGELIGFEADAIQNIILDLCGVPDEETPFEILGIDTKGMHEQQIEYGFCRDSIDEMFWNLEYFEDEIELACDALVIGLMDEWMPDEQYITKRTDE